MNKNVFLKKYKYLFIFLLYIILQYKFIHKEWFVTDELDLMLGGKSISKGYILYKDFLSQHMPFSYYISAFFDILGAKTVSLQRFYFYSFFSLFWTIISKRYQKIIDQRALLIYPFIFICYTSTYDMGHAILSEHIAGIGCVIIFLEFTNFFENGEMNWHNYLFISISIIFTFGTIFVAVFSLFIICCSVIIKEYLFIKNDNKNIIYSIRSTYKKYLNLTFFIIAPWIILIINYILKDNFKNFIFSSYIMNREIYSKYQSGYGSSIIGAVLGITGNISNTFKGLFVISNFTYVSFLHIIIFLGVFIFIYKALRKFGKIYAITIFLFVSALGTRGIFNFHGTQCVEVMSLFFAIVLIDYYSVYDKLKVLIFLLFFIISLNYIDDLSGFSNIRLKEERFSKNSIIVEAITDKKEAIWVLNFDNTTPMQSDRAAIQNISGVPWFWEAHGKIGIERLKKDKPKVCLMWPHHEVWGYKLSEYAPELIQYIENNYILYEKGEGVYIHKDYYNKAIEILKEKDL